MKLIADSGSTKTDWCLVDADGLKARLKTQGINPLHQDADAIAAILAEELKSQLCESDATEVWFYGSGVRPEQVPCMEGLLRHAFPHAALVSAQNDLLGAARALCGHEEGIACILGTGANSCLYDGQRIVRNTPPLGYILGDEGSGAVLGARFLNALLKGFLSSALREEFFCEQHMTEADVIERVYRQPLANRWLASLSPFISRHLDEPQLSALVVDNFRSFVRRNVVQYARPDLPLSVVGSIAWYYQAELAEAVAAEGFTLGKVLQSPMDGLVNYHQS